jgi:hypothetical protein
MGLFDRRQPSRPTPEPDDDDTLDHQGMALELLGGWTGHDDTQLASLTDTELDAQVAARQALYDYVDAIWEDAKARDLDPATLPEWSAVAGMRDLTQNMLIRAQDVQYQRDE